MKEPTLYISIDGGVQDGDLIFSQPVSAGSTLTVGRALKADVRIPIEYDVAGLEHCRIRVEAEELFLDTLPLHAVRLDQEWIEEAEVDTTRSRLLFGQKRTHDLELGAAFRGDPSEAGFSPFRLRLGLADRAIQAKHLSPTTRDKDSAQRVSRSQLRTGFSNFVSLATLLVASTGLTFGASDWYAAAADRIRDEEFQKEVRETVDAIANVRVGLASMHAAAPWVEENKSGIWLIGSMNEARPDEFKGYGTAWVYHPDGQRPVLVTNQHVIDLLGSDRPEDGWAPYIRRSDEENTFTLRLHWGSRKTHPHLQRLSSFVGEDYELRKANVFDLATIQLLNSEKDPDLAQHALSIGDPSEADVGEFVGYIGFPSENLGASSFQSRHPEPTFVKGTIARISDLFGLTTEIPQHRNLMLVDMTAMGGASGSPLFNSEGNVIGIVSSGDVLHIDASSVAGNRNTPPRSTVRIPVGFTNAYAAHLVRELVDESTLPDRNRHWRETKAAIGEDYSRQAAQLARLQARICATGNIRTINVVDGTDVVDETDKPGERVQLDGEGWPAMTTLSLDELPDLPSGSILFSARSMGNKAVGLGVTETGPARQTPPAVGIEDFAMIHRRLADPRRTRLDVSGSPEDEVQVLLHYCMPE